MDSFLGGQFSTYGLDVIRISGMEVSSLFREITILSFYPFSLPYFCNSQTYRYFRFTLFLGENLWPVIDDKHSFALNPFLEAMNRHIRS